jgi:hypothetical protein
MNHNRLHQVIRDYSDEYIRTQKDKINVHDNDEIYILNDDKDNQYLDENYGENLNVSENKEDNFEEEFEMDNEQMNAEDIRDLENSSDVDTVRNKLETSNHNNHNNNHNQNYYHNKVLELNGSSNTNSHKKCKYINYKLTDSERSKSMSNLITLKYISVCQCCKENFNSSSNIPYLLKCGHFFCRSCLMNNFTEEGGTIICPDDGIIANSINDLKLLSNLIIDKSLNNEQEKKIEKDGVIQFIIIRATVNNI